MIEDTLLQEVRAARENYARSHGYDIEKIVADLSELDRQGGWRVVKLVPRRPAKIGASESPNPSPESGAA
jgi:hypothetical protein